MNNIKPIRDEENEHMTAEIFTAYSELVELGCPVKIWHQLDREYQDYRGFFWLSAEEEGAEEWLDYWSNYSGSDKLNEILKKANLWFEWQNSAVGCVYSV